MLVFNNYFYKNRKSNFYFRDRVAVLNDFIYQTGGSIGPEEKVVAVSLSTIKKVVTGKKVQGDAEGKREQRTHARTVKNDGTHTLPAHSAAQRRHPHLTLPLPGEHGTATSPRLPAHLVVPRSCSDDERENGQRPRGGQCERCGALEYVWVGTPPTKRFAPSQKKPPPGGPVPPVP
jgi:hypothetical protein